MEKKLGGGAEERFIALYHDLPEEKRRCLAWLVENLEVAEKMTSTPFDREEWQRAMELAKKNKDHCMEILLYFQDFRGYVTKNEP